MNPLISVIIPAYNIEKYIERSLKSVCDQTYKNLEIIVVDDGSVDATGRVIDRVAKEDERIVVIHRQNAGVSAARNTGLEVAKGEYVGFVDGDDIIEADMYELLLRNALENKADISHCGYQMVFPNRVDYYHNTKEKFLQNHERGKYDLIKADKVEPGLWNKLYKRTLIGSERLDEAVKMNEDLLFNYQMFQKAQISVFEDLPKYHYMVRANSASTSKINKHKLEDPLLVIEKMMRQETGEIYQLLEKRYMYLLEKVSTIRNLDADTELVEIQKERQAELKSRLMEKNMKAVYSKKEMSQLRLAANHPGVYRLVHGVFAAVTGSRNKYKV